MKDKIKVSIIEDSEIHAMCLNEQLISDSDFMVVSVDFSGHNGLASLKKELPDVVLLDFQLPDVTGLEVAKRIKSFSDKIKVFSITSHTEPAIVERMISDKNIDAIAIKGSDYFEDSLISLVKKVASGGSFIDPSLLKTIRSLGKMKGVSDLTKREFEVFIQASVGKSDDDISRDLYVDISHVKNLKSKVSKKIKGDKFDSLLEKLLANMRS